MKNDRSILFAITAALLLASCSQAYKERGWASYIADQYAGKRTTSGEPYNPYGWTAAHHTLPFGTLVKVKNNFNGRAVNLVVNDRFPSYPGRIINVSRAAAEYLGIAPSQMADVTVSAKKLPAGAAPMPQANYGAHPAPANYTPAPQPSASTPPPMMQPPPMMPPPQPPTH